MTEWQPIEVAPENGNFILVCCLGKAGTSSSICLGRREFLTKGDVSDWKWSPVTPEGSIIFVPHLILSKVNAAASITPTHWMPLPAPPQADGDCVKTKGE